MYLQLKDINKTFEIEKVSAGVSFGIEKGRLIALLGPSGSGKTTILRMIAGFEQQDSGDIYINHVCVNEVPVQEREIGFVFQNYALFPYLNVFDNIAYGLRTRRKDDPNIKERVAELLTLVELKGLEKRYPSQLSGGQRQRVAFARALAPNPQLLLLDEPFAAVDAKVRKELRHWLREMIDHLGITSIFVTHDQQEAIEVADELIIMNQGHVEQIGTVMGIYKTPQTPFVAQFIGESTTIHHYERLKGFPAYHGLTAAIIRPEFITVVRYGQGRLYQGAYEAGVIWNTTFCGNYTELLIDIKGIRLKALHSLGEEDFQKGDKVSVLINCLYVINHQEILLLKNELLTEGYTFYI